MSTFAICTPRNVHRSDSTITDLSSYKPTQNSAYSELASSLLTKLTNIDNYLDKSHSTSVGFSPMSLSDYESQSEMTVPYPTYVSSFNQQCSTQNEVSQANSRLPSLQTLSTLCSPRSDCVDGANYGTGINAHPPQLTATKLKRSYPATNSVPTISLLSILQAFQYNITQDQAWALIYQSVKSLDYLLFQYENDECISELFITKLTSFSDILIDSNGNVSSSTWKRSSSPFIGKHANINKIEDKRLMNESINSIIASLAKVIYEALELNFKQSRCHHGKNDIIDSNNDDFEMDLEEDLELLMIYMLRGFELEQDNKNIADEGYIDVLEENCIPLVVSKCDDHFKNCILSRSQKCPIIEMIFEKHDYSVIDAELYYKTVCQVMVEESLKLKFLVGQLSDNRNNNIKNHISNISSGFSLDPSTYKENLKQLAPLWIKVMSELRFGVHLRPTKSLESKPRNSEQIDEPFNKLMHQIRNLDRSTLNKAHLKANTSSISLPEISFMQISQEILLDKLKNLKPALERNLKPLPETKPCLHERLMNEIRLQNVKLRPCKTVVKSFLESKSFQKRQRYQDINSEAKYSLSSHLDSCNELRHRSLQGSSLSFCRCLSRNELSNDFVANENSNGLYGGFRRMSVNKRKTFSGTNKHKDIDKSFCNLSFQCKNDHIKDDDSQLNSPSWNKSLHKKKRLDNFPIGLSPDANTECELDSNSFSPPSSNWKTSTPKNKFSSSSVSLNTQNAEKLTVTNYPTCTCSTTEFNRFNQTEQFDSNLLRRSFIKKKSVSSYSQISKDKPLNSTYLEQKEQSIEEKGSLYRSISFQNFSFVRKPLASSLTNMFYRLSFRTKKSQTKVKEE